MNNVVMAQFWGPLGWMTLHSISSIYPDNPSEDDKKILVSFMSAFQETISCPSCKSHFTSMFAFYKSRNPNWLNSRYDFFLFVCRAHNTVNSRLDKPKPATLSESLELFKKNTVHTTPHSFREKYINYLTYNWGKELTGDSMMMMTRVKELRKINEQYWNNRDSNLESLVILADMDVLTPIPENPTRTNVGGNVPNFAAYPNVRLGFKGGKLKLTQR
jgi:hypothetical protein